MTLLQPWPVRLRPPVRGGFTLVEVAMAVAILALVLTTSLTVMQRVFTELDTARNLEIATNILQCEMEEELRQLRAGH